MHHTIPNHYPNRYTAQPVRSIIKNKAWHPVKQNHMKFDRVICEYERRAEDRLQQQQQQQQQCHSSINTNKYSALANDALEAYGNYHQSWSLDTAASGNYCGNKTKIVNRKKTTTGNIQVGVANNQSMIQSEEGELPFDCLPKSAKDVQAFPNMQSPLIGCGKLATSGCGIWFDDEKGSVVTDKLKDKIRSIIASQQGDVLLAAPFDNKSLTWKTVPAPRVGLNPTRDQYQVQGWVRTRAQHRNT